MKNPKFKLLLAVSMLVLSVMACTLPGLPFQSTNVSTPGAVQATEPSTIGQAPQETLVVPDEMLMQDALVKIYQNVSPGVVSIQVYSSDGSSALGSGFVVDKEGHIVTNYHVVQDADKVEVHFPDGLKVYGDVIGQDLDSDIAVISVDVAQDELFPLTLGDSNQLQVGQSVVAIGNPFGLTGTMTQGIISAQGRTLQSIRQTEAGNFFSAGDLIQTDANINPGNSGGPLLNLNGEVIGINRAIQTGSGLQLSAGSNTGIGFAVSSNILKLVLPTLIKGETYNYPYLGLSSLPSLTLEEADMFSLSQATGAYVVEVVPDGPADKAGIKAGDTPTDVQGYYAGGDLIIQVDNVQVLQFSDLLSYMMLNKQPGDQMNITVLRGGEQMQFTVTLGERPANGQ